MRLLIFTAIILVGPTLSFAQETLPGVACTAGETNFIRQSGGPETSGVVHLMHCDGTTWQPYQTFLEDGKAGIGTDTPAAMLDVDGDLRIGTTSDSCSSSKEGAIRYTGGSPPWEYCDGGGPGWLPFEQAGACTAPALCMNIGDVCDDGNPGTANDPIFAGFMVDHDASTCRNIYVTNQDQGSSLRWKTSVGSNDIANDYFSDGKLNTQQVPNSTVFPAFKACKDLTDGGFSDWYLPSKEELTLLWLNRVEINANAVGSFSVFGYPSSTEANLNTVWTIDFNIGTVFRDNKTVQFDVRCIRTD